MNLNEQISQNLPDQLLVNIAEQAGIQDPEVGLHASKSIIQTILHGLANNTQDESGITGLIGALNKDHDGSILKNVLGFLNGQQQGDNPSMLNGAGILRHILGSKQDKVTNSMGNFFGLDASTILQLMISLAPVVMGLLGKAKANRQLNSENVQQVLGQAVNEQPEQNQETGMGIFGRLLDGNKDGNISDDLLQMGMKFLLKK